MTSEVGERPVTEELPPGRARASFETWSWLFMRISGLALVFQALLHFAITHVLNDVTDTDYHFVANRWSNPLWRVFDWTLLALALLHGLNGLRWIVDDYVRQQERRRAVKGVLYGLTGVLLVMGTLTILASPTRSR